MQLEFFARPTSVTSMRPCRHKITDPGKKTMKSAPWNSQVGLDIRAQMHKPGPGGNAKAATERMFGFSAIITPNGKRALDLLLRHLKVEPTDEVFITSTFGTRYVSSCITCTIFNHCKPSKTLTSHTKLILIIHEFGVPHPQLDQMRAEANRQGISMLEDCARSAESTLPSGARLGTVGDFAIYSLRKILPLADGGLLFGLDSQAIVWERYEEPVVQDIASQLTEALSTLNWTGKRRRQVWQCMKEHLPPELGQPIFSVNENISPYLFVFRPDIPAAVLLPLLQKEMGWADPMRITQLEVLTFPVHQLIELEEVNTFWANGISNILNQF